MRDYFSAILPGLADLPTQRGSSSTSGAYVKHLNTGVTHDLHDAKLAPRLLGAARRTNFSIGPITNDQGPTFSIGKGIWILDAGFGTVPGSYISYGVTLTASRPHWLWT